MPVKLNDFHFFIKIEYWVFILCDVIFFYKVACIGEACINIKKRKSRVVTV